RAPLRSSVCLVGSGENIGAVASTASKNPSWLAPSKPGGPNNGARRGGKAVASEERDGPRDGGREDHQLESDRDESRPAVQRASADVDRIRDHHEGPLHRVAPEAARDRRP